MTCKRVLLWGVLLAVLAPPALGAQAGPDCAAWNTQGYFRTATVEDVTACLAAGADVAARNSFGETPLHWAAYNEKPAVVQALLAGGADPNARTEDGLTPLLLAVRYTEDPAVIQALLAAGADPNARAVFGLTALHLAVKSHRVGVRVVQALLGGGANTEARDENGRTPLHDAVSQQRGGYADRCGSESECADRRRPDALASCGGV